MSKQRSIRKKTLSYDDEDEDHSGSKARPPASVKAAQAQREKEKKRAESKSLLSFDEDNGVGDDSLASRKKAGTTKPKASLRAPSSSGAAEMTLPAVPSTQVSAAGEYTADKIKELQRNAIRTPTAKPAERASLVGGTFKLSGSFKPAGAPKDSRYQYDVVPAAVLRAPEKQAQQTTSSGSGAASEDQEMPLPPPPPHGSTVGATSRAPSAASGHVSSGVGDVVRESDDVAEEDDELDIPDERMIQWAKAKRERLRSAHLAPDYIPTAAMPGLSRLRDKKLQEEAAGAASESDDELEDEMRLKFVGAAVKKEKPVLAAAVPERPLRPGSRRWGEAEEEEEEEEEEDYWANEQIRKGMGGLSAVGPSTAATTAGVSSHPSDVGEPGGQPAWGSVTGLGGGSQAAKVNAAAEEVLTALQQGLQRLQTSQQQAERNLSRTTGNLQGAINSISRMEGELQGASDKYVYLQKLRSYIQDLCYMLQDKSPLVEELEDQLLQLYEDRARAFQEKRRLDDEESHQPAEAVITAALGVLSRGGAPAAAAAAADVVAEEAERRQQGEKLPEELDEFGRDMNSERRRDAAKRAKRRQARLAEAAKQLSSRGPGEGPQAELRLGECTSEESEGEAAHFRLRQGEIQEAADAVLKDAADEFSSLTAVKRQLEAWKAHYPGAYRDAYVAVSAPALFAPFVRLELLKWKPLEGGGAASAGFDSHQWYQQLFDYGMGTDPAAADPEDPDANLVPQLVQKLVLPLAKHLLEAVWDPLSRRQTRAAAAMVGDLMVYVPAEDEGLQSLLRLVQSRLEAAIESTTLPSWPPSAVAASVRAEAFLCHRFGRALRLLQNVCSFEGTLPRVVVQELALEKLLSCRMLPFIRVAASDVNKAVDRIQRTVTVLPAEWFKGGQLRGCEGLLDFCNTLARSLEAQAGQGDKEMQAANAASARLLSQAVMRLGGDASKANRLAKAYGVL